jgi:hypothetical protein
MAVLEIVTPSTLPVFATRVDLEGASYELRFRWNGREARWLLDIYDGTGETVVHGLALLADTPIAEQIAGLEGVPPGVLFPFDTSFRQLDPGVADLGERVLVMYREAAE